MVRSRRRRPPTAFSAYFRRNSMLNHTRPWRPFLAVMSFALLAACSHHEAEQSMATPADNGLTMMQQSSTGTVMTTPTGMTVYTYDKDIVGRSNCTGECA